MSEIALSASQEFLKALCAAQYVQKGYTREDIEDFLAPVDRILNLERDEDEAFRAVQRVIMNESTDFKQFWALLNLARAMEESTNSLMKAAYIMRDYVLENANVHRGGAGVGDRIEVHEQLLVVEFRFTNVTVIFDATIAIVSGGHYLPHPHHLSFLRLVFPERTVTSWAALSFTAGQNQFVMRALVAELPLLDG